MIKSATGCLLVCFVLLTLRSPAQEELAEPLDKEFSFNCLPLVTSLLPFETNPVLNLSDVSLMLKKRLGDSNTYGRTGLSLFIVTDSDFSANQFIFRKGIEKKRALSKHWLFHNGGDVFLSAVQASSTSTRAELGFAFIYGVQFMFNERIALGTEGFIELALLTSDDGTSLTFKQPRTLLFSIYF